MQNLKIYHHGHLLCLSSPRTGHLLYLIIIFKHLIFLIEKVFDNLDIYSPYSFCGIKQYSYRGLSSQWCSVWSPWWKCRRTRFFHWGQGGGAFYDALSALSLVGQWVHVLCASWWNRELISPPLLIPTALHLPVKCLSMCQKFN